MKKLFIYVLTVFLGTATALAGTTDKNLKLYEDLQLKNEVSYTAFDQAMKGFGNIDRVKKDVLVLIDFSKPSTDERLYVLDLKNKQTLFRSHVSHGQNSGGNYATSFSNTPGSHQSSLGFYVTENTYTGKNGYSLKLDGLEKGINDKAKERAIVIHGADYANPSVVASSGRLGRSHGCPALPRALNKDIIDTIKEGALIYIYANDSSYVKNSTVLNDRI